MDGHGMDVDGCRFVINNPFLMLLYPTVGRCGTGSGPALPSTQPFCVTPPLGSMEELHVRERAHVKIDDGIWDLEPEPEVETRNIV